MSEDVVELTPGLWSIGQKKGGRVHAFLCDDGNELTLVDTLFDTDGKRILGVLEQLGKQPSDLRNIVITHGHRSHLGGLAALADVTGATVHAHAWEADIVGGDREAQRVSLIPSKPLRTYFPFQFGSALGVREASAAQGRPHRCGRRPDRAAARARRPRPLPRAPRVLVAGAERAHRRRRDRDLAVVPARLAVVHAERAPAPRHAAPPGRDRAGDPDRRPRRADPVGRGRGRSATSWTRSKSRRRNRGAAAYAQRVLAIVPVKSLSRAPRRGSHPPWRRPSASGSWCRCSTRCSPRAARRRPWTASSS